MLSDVNVTAGAVAADNATVLRMIQAFRGAAATGRIGEADQILARVAQLAPAHPAVLNELGMRMMQRGEAAKARELFQRAVEADPNPTLWSNLASSLQALGLPREELDAIERALALEPRHLAALLQKATLFERTDDPRNAARAYRNALATLPAGVKPPVEVAALVEHARAAVAADDTALASAIAESLRAVRERHADAQCRRVEHCIDLVTARRRRFDPQPTFMYFPEIPAVEFFDRDDFPWLDAIEAASDEIRAELMTVLVSDREGLEPYIDYREGTPLNQWKELNKSRRWSAYFLWNQSVPQAAHLALCPRTAEVLKGAPQCDVAGRGPTAFFSILEAGTRIPPHTGVTNTRLTVHLPLIVPPDCGFRVGSETREWIAGKALVFDDTIEHEAWNLSEVPRAVLIFDVWNPFLTVAERDLIRAATEAIGAYYGSSMEGGL